MKAQCTFSPVMVCRLMRERGARVISVNSVCCHTDKVILAMSPNKGWNSFSIYVRCVVPFLFILLPFFISRAAVLPPLPFPAIFTKHLRFIPT